MNSTRTGRTRMAIASVAALAVLAACGDDDPVTTGTEASPPSTSLSIASPAVGAVVKGNVVTLDLVAKGVSIVKADGDTSGRTGHYHVFVDRDPVAAGAVIPKDAGILHSTDDPIVISGLAVGNHRLAVVLGDGTHTRIGTMVAETSVRVEGPSVDASAPATSPAGQPVMVSVKVEGFSLVKADGDVSGATGHLHVFIDRDPTPAGQPIPVEAGIIHSAASTIEVPGLTPGEHVLWVVAGDGAHVPLASRVMDKLTVAVS